MRYVLGALIVLLVAGCQTTGEDSRRLGSDCSDGAGLAAVKGDDLCLAAKTYGAVGAQEATLVVFLHGDLSGGGPADYMARRADAVARMSPSVIAVALARPGYGFGDGATSTGTNNGRRDSYTAANVDAIGDAVRQLRALHQPARTVLVGHSGGAAIAGVVAGRHPDVADAFVLVACPCDVAAWRASRSRQPWPNSLSPSSFVQGVSSSAQIIAVTGALDRNTDERLGQRYVEQLLEAGKDAEYRRAPGAGHNLDEALWSGGASQAVLDAILGEARTASR